MARKYKDEKKPLTPRDRLDLATARARGQGVAPPVEIEGALRYPAEEQAKVVQAQEAKVQEETLTKGVQARPTLEAAGAFEKVTPQEVSLQPTPQFGEKAPIVGRTMAVQFGVLDTAVKKGWIPGFLLPKETVKGAKAAVPTAEEEFPLPMTPETLRETALREVRAKAFEKGISESEAFGAMVEAIPGVGGLVGKYVGGLVEAPYSNQKKVLNEINKIKEAASTGQEKVRNGLEDPEYGLTRARKMEADVAKLEGRMKLLINSSAILRANMDEVNTIQEQILEAREKISRYKQASSFGLTAKMTDTGRTIPTDEELYFTLKDLKGGK